MSTTNNKRKADASSGKQGERSGGDSRPAGPFTDGRGVLITSVGYTFEKYFAGHGWFKGTVVEIRPGAANDKNRRCKYEDGDVEDLSLSQLHYLYHQAQKKKQQQGKIKASTSSAAGTSARGGADNNSNNRPKKKPRKQTSGVGGAKKKQTKGHTSTKQSSRQQEQPDDIFADLESFCPEDQGAEATLALKSSARASSGAASESGGGEADDGAKEETETGAWLAKVAVALGASSHGGGSGKGGGGGGRKRSSNQTSPSASARSMSPPPPQFAGAASTGANGGASVAASASGSASRTNTPIPFASGVVTARSGGTGKFVVPRNASPSSSVSMECLTSLANIGQGKRHNTRVFRADDRKRIVGEVIMEHGGGYVEVIIDNCQEKGRLRAYVVAPEKFKVGDKVPAHLPLPERPISGKGKKSGRTKVNDGAFPQLCQQINPNASMSRSSSVGVETPSKRSSMTSTSAASLRAKTASPSSGPRKEKISVDDLFYWCCVDCTMANPYNKPNCSVCGEKRKAEATQSPLLEVAAVAVAAATSVDEAKDCIPTFNAYAIPDVVLSYLLSSKTEDGKVGSSVDSFRKSCEPPSTNLNDYFYWICGYCSLKNRFWHNKCSVCKKKRSVENASASSSVLEIALKASEKAHTVSEAMNSIPISQRRSIPESVLRSLVTCIAVVGGSQSKGQHRCRNTKAPGLDYCTYHCNDPLLLSAGETYGDQGSTDRKMASDAENAEETNEATAPDNFEAMSANLSQYLQRSSSIHHINKRRWDIRGAEDSILSQTTGPFPLGLMVRKFWVGHGFHDGRIIKVIRQNLNINDEEVRPVLIYRVLYNDGDCEDLLVHEVNSLRQIYDRCNIDSTALPSVQIPKGSLFEMYHQETSFVMVEGHQTPSTIQNIRPDEGGLVDIKVCKALGQPWLTINQSDLVKFQLSIDRMLPPNESITVGPAKASSLVSDESIQEYNDKLCMRTNSSYTEALPSCTAHRIRPNSLNADDSRNLAPVLEWPGPQPSEGSTAAVNQGSESEVQRIGGASKDNECEITSSLWLVNNVEVDAHVACEDIGKDSFQYMDDTDCVRKCISRPQTGWDPANASPYIRWDPYRNIVCSRCNLEENDHQVVICDGCNIGIHTYCMRPVMNNVPTGDWYCDRCKSVHDAARQPYSSLLAELEKDPAVAMAFLGHSFDATKFYEKHNEGLTLFGPETAPHIRRKRLGSSKSTATAKIGDLYFSWNIKPDDLVLPRPPLSVEGYNTVTLSWVASMKYVGMSKYSEELTYSADVPENMNDASLEDGVVEPLPRRVEEIFREFKMNLSQGADSLLIIQVFSNSFVILPTRPQFPPLQIVHDPNVGFTTVALEDMKKHTVITEYVGEVTTVEHTAGSSSDSLMFLLSTGDDSTSLMIDPTTTGNIARFLSGINNRSNLSKKNANVRTRRFVLDGQCRVALFTSRKIIAGEILHYDYNAGIEGKSVDEWKDTGFYDTSNFF